ncbi:hypothetical protein [Pseudarthrobacter sp. ATCC 49987]|uniref:hypothetical protein n=1 Tax=Pseudarthrobacter sp. ATCC 49987 TaxID=2698204 RepID=UPI001367ACE3|nr:hypothetical protein [Pseudarthrobacter sp. ATCC 49987]
MGEVVNINTKQKEVTPSLSLELRLEARRLDDYQDLGPVDLIAKAEHYLDLEQTDLTALQRKDLETVLGYVFSEMELRGV